MVRATRSGPPHHHRAAHAHGRYANRPWLHRMLGRDRARRARHGAVRRGMGDGRRPAPPLAVQQLHAARRVDGHRDSAAARRIRAAPRQARTRFRGGSSRSIRRGRLGGSMSSHIRATRAAVAAATAFSLFLSQIAPGLNAQTTTPTPAPAQTSTAKPVAAAPPATDADVDGGWPRDFTTPGGAALRVFQPQIASWDGQKQMVAYSAASYVTKGAQKPSLGTLKFEAKTSVAVAERLVNFSDVKLTETNFQNIPKDSFRT